MAKFGVSYSSDYANLEAQLESGDVLTTDDILECLRPAAMKLVEFYKQTIRKLFKRQTGSLEDSIDFDDSTVGKYAFITVKPFGAHAGGKYARKSRAGSSDRKYAKHNRSPSSHDLKNEELAYLLEYGTPRIKASHWMENTNEEVSEDIQNIIEEEFDKLLKKKGLI